MATDVQAQDRVARFRELFADAPAIGRSAAENVLKELASKTSREPASRMESAGRVGSRQGKVSELTLVVPLAAGGAERLRAFLQLTDGDFDEADMVGTVHDMRFVFLDNDTKMLFATAYDGDWDAYIDDFATKVPDEIDLLFHEVEDYPGIHHPRIKDFIVKSQVTASAFYSAYPDATVRDIWKALKTKKALDELLDQA